MQAGGRPGVRAPERASKVRVVLMGMRSVRVAACVVRLRVAEEALLLRWRLHPRRVHVSMPPRVKIVRLTIHVHVHVQTKHRRLVQRTNARLH